MAAKHTKTTKLTKRNHLIALMLAITVLALSAIAASNKRTVGLELVVLRSINDLPQLLRLPFSIITQAGSEWMLFGVTLLLLGLKKSRLALRFFAAGTIAFIISQVFKQVVARQRPYYSVSDLHVREFMRIDYGFPSSHAAIATACALVIMPYIPSKWRWICIVWIVLVGLSRMYLGVHAPLDVIGGIATGVCVVSSGALVHGKLKTVRKITGLKLQR